MKKNWRIGHADVKTSNYLDVEMSDVQRNLLNPTPKDVKGKGAVQKIAKRKNDFIEGNVNGYSRLLNNPKRLEEASKDHAQLVATVAEVSARS